MQTVKKKPYRLKNSKVQSCFQAVHQISIIRTRYLLQVNGSEIIERLAVIGIVYDRRTLYKDVELLNESGYEVLYEKAPGKPNGYCVADRSFNVSELRILIFAFLSSTTKGSEPQFRTFCVIIFSGLENVKQSV